MKIIVDDRDPSITYTPVWNTQGNDGLPRSRQQEFEGTTSQPIQSSTNSASFAFTGTRITVFAAVAGLPQGDLEIGIDGRLQRILLPNVSDSSPVFHNPAFDSGPLADGQYTLVMQDVTTGPSVFFFDYMIYETNARGQGQTGFVDDADPSVLFLGSWSQNNTLDFMQHGVHYTGQAGSSFTVSYNFLDGDKLVLFGPLTAADPQFSSALPLSASVSIDGAGPVTLSSQNAPSSGQTLFNQKLYTSSPLAAGQHTFNFSYRSGTPLCVDYFLIEPGSGPVKASNSKSAFPVSITQSPTTGLTWGVPGTSTAIPSPSSATGNYTSHTGAIVGGVLGGILLLLLAIGLIMWLRRRHARRVNQQRATPLDVEIATATPHSHLSKSALTGERVASPRTPQSSIPSTEETRLGQTALSAFAVQVPTEELVRILNTRLQSNAAFQVGEEDPPSYPPTQVGSR